MWILLESGIEFFELDLIFVEIIVSINMPQLSMTHVGLYIDLIYDDN